MSKTETAQSTLTIQLLGRFEVLVDGTAIDDSAWRGRKAQQLVKLLAVASGRSLHREQIADALWPDLDVEAADRQLHKAIHAARRALEPDLAAGADSTWLLTQDRTVALSPEVDVDADTAEATAEAALSSLEWSACDQALAGFRGSLLPSDLYDDWTEARRARLSALHARLLSTVAEGAAAAGRFDRAAIAANRLLEIDPADERAHRALMLVAAASGDRSTVVRQYRNCEAVLESELGVEPSDATRALYASLIEGSNGSGAPTVVQTPVAEAGAADDVRAGARSRDGASTRDTGIPLAAGTGARVGTLRTIPWVRMAVLLAAILVVGTSVAWWLGPSFRRAPPATVATITGQLPSAFVRVSSPSSASGWSAFTDADGRFVLRDAGLRVGDDVTLIVETGGTDRRSIVIHVTGVDDAGVADVGVIGPSMLSTAENANSASVDTSLAFDRANLDWYRGVVSAVTSGLAADRDRVSALHAFVTKRYARPFDNGSTDTPRRTIEVGTLFSGPLPLAMATLTQASGYPTRLVAISTSRLDDIEHTVVEVFYDGRWHLFDPAFGVVAVNDLGEVANLEDLVRHPSLIDRMAYAAAERPGWRGAEIPALLRSGVHRVTELRDAVR